MPHLVGVVAVYANGKHFHPQLLKFRILDGNCRQFRRSNTGEIGRVEAKHYPFASIVGELDLFGRTFMIRLGGKIRRTFAYLHAHFDTLLSRDNLQ